MVFCLYSEIKETDDQIESTCSVTELLCKFFVLILVPERSAASFAKVNVQITELVENNLGIRSQQGVTNSTSLISHS